ncbi:concanavalin A-like lectin/glucanase domain-containing protein [Mycena galopus ATCC 62051]|nr:concanavalin A-like lectin/glucanase domain-containing protein [Mycena galopus ATCC 62051]
MNRPAPLSFTLPPNPPFASNNANGSDSSEPPSPTTAAGGSRGASPPVTPRTLSFLTPHAPPHSSSATHVGTPPAVAAQNPFSPPASVRSFSATPGAETPHGHGHNASIGSGYPFPYSAGSTRASSLVDVPRAYSTYSLGGGAGGRGSLSRPSTGTSLHPAAANGGATAAASGVSFAIGGNASAAASVVDGKPTKREAFASPPARPLTIYAAPSTARLRRDRPKRPQGQGRVLDHVFDDLLGHRRRRSPRVPRVDECPHAKGPLCPVLLEDFSTATTDSLFGSGVAGEGGTFFREVDASGFGNGEFEMTTNSDANSFVYNNQLYLVPTLTSTVIPQSSILDGAVYNLTGCTYNITHSTGYTTEGFGAAGINSTQGTDGGDAAGIGDPDAPLDLPAYLAACSAVSNKTEGKILPPVMSARISTRKSATLKFGRVEVVAKLPTGDWLWPAIWMLPVDNVYGAWPLSGEIDIMEARGNPPSYPKQGINYVRSSLNWGPTTFLNAVAKTYGWWTQRRGRYDTGFHTYALEWDEEFIRMYVDSRLDHMYETKLSQSFWERGDFPTVVMNGTESVVLENPWVNGTKAAPFDQSFYLIMNVAVGGTNGWFPDGPEKPWLDGSGSAARDFLNAQDQWYPSWPQDTFGRAMVVDSVKMWEQC